MPKNNDNLLHPQNASRFMALLLIWSFTPLAVVVSVQEMSSLWAFCIRFLCAAPLAHLLLKARGQNLPITTETIKSYLAGALSIFAAMLLTYVAASKLPSGVISMIFGLSPLVSGLIGLVVYQKQLHLLQWLGILLGLFGLSLALGLFSKGLSVNAQALTLVLGAMFLSVVSLYLVNHIQTEAHLRMPTRLRRPRFANSMTLVRLNLALDNVVSKTPAKNVINQAKQTVKTGTQHVKAGVSNLKTRTKSKSVATQDNQLKVCVTNLTPLMQTVGALWVSFFGVLFLLPFIWQTAPTTLPSTRGLVAIGFLILLASMMAFVFLFELNQRISPTAVSMVTIITPLLATLWGAWLNSETIGTALLWGLGCIVIGLSVYIWGGEKNKARPAEVA